MKIVIAAEDGDLIRNVVEKQGHAVVAETNDPAHLFELVLQHTPHLVFVEKSEQATRGLERLKSIFDRVRFIVLGLERGTTWTKTIRQALRLGKINTPWRAETPDQRQIIFDARYYSLCSATKLKRSGGGENSSEETDIQLLRLMRMLQAAKDVRDRADRYAEATFFIDDYEWQETIYRTTHGSFKGPAYGRDQLGRSLGYLARFIPGIDLDGLPHPVNEPADLRFLHYHAPVEMHYALFCLAAYGFNLDIAKQLYHAIHWRFEGESTEDLTRTSIVMTGLAFTLHRIALAHATVIDWMLDPHTLTRLDEPPPRPLHRAIQTFTDFWAFRNVMDYRDRLRLLLNDLHSNPAESPLPQGLKLPTFAEFLEAMAASDETKTTQN